MVREILPPTRSVVAAIGAVMAGVGCAVLATGIAFDASLPLSTTLSALAIGGVFAAGLLLMGLKLLAGGGSVLVDDAGDRLGIGITSRRDIWWIARERVAGLRVVDDDERAKDIHAAWIATLELVDGPSVVLARHVDRHMIDHVVTKLSEALGVPTLDAPRDEDDGDGGGPSVAGGRAAGPAEARFAVQRGAALQWILFFLGLSMLLVGVVMIGQVEERPVFGFIFGPLLAAIGLVFLVVAGVKRLATEHLRYDGTHWTHAFTFGRWRWSERRVTAAAPHWRFQVHALRGAHLELVAADGILVMASGATTRSRFDLQRLAQLPTRFAPADIDAAARP